MFRKACREWALRTSVVALVACVPFGAGMAVYTDNVNWLWFCAALAILA